ncbi:MAG: SDR family oxidoreductase [Desulfovibrio sp.]|nr:SDR family oxidoreductase [Desulfovibrio sp.]MBI4957864.1 SDR family oxidoreductase [Desulfovibrio sp.]
MSFIESLFGLAGRVALVTGGNSGLGLAMARALAFGGARVVLCGRNAQRLQTAVEDLGDCAGQAACVEFDVSLTDRLPELAHLAARPFGPPDILVNAAGVNPRLPWEQVDVASWEKTLAVNLGAAFFLAKELVGSMLNRGFGRIINLASLQSVRAFENSVAYGASKGGVSQLTRAMAEAWSRGKSGVTANAVAPGFFKTRLTEPLFEQPGLAEGLASKTLIGRTGEPEDIHGITLFLASQASSYVTGQVLFLDGGWTAA